MALALRVYSRFCVDFAVYMCNSLQVNLVLDMKDLEWALDTAVQQLRGAEEGGEGSGG